VVEDSTDDAKLQRLSTAEKEEAAQVQTETLIDCQATRHDRLPSLLVNGDKISEIMFG
jgi:hypothetical protein